MAKGKGTASFKATIKAYLDQRAATDKLFAASYAKADKNIDDCIGYIFAEVQKSGCNGFTDEEIYGMAVHYYDEDDLGEVKTPRNVSVVVNHQVELTEEEIAAAKARAIAQVEAEQRRQLQEKAAASAVPAAKPKKQQPKPQAAQLDLFSFMEGDSDEA